MSRKKKHPEHVNLERWLVSYADFITLLFAFFVILYATSKTDAARFKAVAESIKEAFGVHAGGAINLQGAGGGTQVGAFVQAPQQPNRLVQLDQGELARMSEADPSLKAVQEALENSISVEMGINDPGSELRMIYDSRGLVVRLAANDIFSPGETMVKADLLPLLDQIGKVVASAKTLVRVEGHADPAEVQILGGHASTWELSAGRAAWVSSHWSRVFKIDPKRVGVAGYGHHRPLTAKTDDWSRGTNRRVEIIFLNNLYDKP